MLRAREARHAAATFKAEGASEKGPRMSPRQQDVYKGLLDALDERQRRLGVPEEL